MPQTTAETILDRKARKLVEREVFACLSMLVSRVQELDPEDEALMELHTPNDADREYALEEGIDPDDYWPEIYEYWAVSDYLADKLEEKGAHVCHDFYGLAVWGRETTGQAIYMDGIIREIATTLGDAWAE